MLSAKNSEADPEQRTARNGRNAGTGEPAGHHGHQADVHQGELRVGESFGEQRPPGETRQHVQADAEDHHPTKPSSMR